MNLVVYTAIAADYDELRSPRLMPDGVDFVCFTEPGKSIAAGWTQQDLPYLDLSPQSQNRYVKFHPHLLFPEHDTSIYIDGSIEVVGDVRPLAQQSLATAPIAFYDHPVRTSTLSEVIRCALHGFDSLGRIWSQYERYVQEGFSDSDGLFEANVIVRAHLDIQVCETMECWWGEWQRGVKRDQLSLMYVLWRTGLAVASLGRHDARFGHRYFVMHPHRQQPRRGLGRLGRQLVNRARLKLKGL